MARARIDFFSDVLGLNTSMTVIFPQETNNLIGMAGSKVSGEVPVLWLLHGLSDDDTIWERRTSIERYVADKGIAVIMPQVHRSFYTDQELGHNYWTYISEELPAIARKMLRISDKREDNFVAGLSMGGYGAMKLALNHPERFAAAASFSGCVGLGHPGNIYDFMERDYELVFGKRPVVGSKDDVLHLLEIAEPKKLPKLMVTCGTEDFLYHESQAFMKIAEQRGIQVHSNFGPGDHEWPYWDANIQEFLDWIDIRTA